jgi:hypothetical protein
MPSPSHVSLALICRPLTCVAPVPCSPSQRHWSPPHFRCLVLVVCLAPACGVLHPCPHPCPGPGPGPCTPPIHPVSSCLQRRWGVLGCGSGCSPRARCPCHASLPHASGPVILSLSLVLPISTPRAVACGGGSGCCCAGRRGHHSATGQGQWRRGGVTGAYLAGIPLQGSPSTLRTPFIIHTSSSFVRHCMPFVFVCMLSSFVCCCPSSFVCRPCGNVPRNIVENSLLVKDKKDERYKKTRLGPKQLLSSFGPTFLPID